MPTYCLDVSGDYACFTRPEMKVERVSYDVITPSAARAIFEAILWKPALRWHVRQVEVLKPIRWIALRRNEVAGKIPVNTVRSAMRRGTGQLGLSVEDDRQQRAGLFLRDVRYRLYADLEVLPQQGAENTAAKFHSMFERRARKGQCFTQPYLGCREFAAYFSLVDAALHPCTPPDETRDLGWMLYDLDYRDRENPQPRFFRAQLAQGVMGIPDWQSEEVRG